MIEHPDVYMKPTLTVELLSPHARLPEKAHDGDLGYDLYCAESVQILPGKMEIVGTGIRVAFPHGYGGKIFDRSSTSTQRNLIVIAGVIDNGYRGEIKIALYNYGSFIRTMNIGDKMAQMVLIPTVNFPVVEGKIVVEETSRQDGGFGSTGS